MIDVFGNEEDPDEFVGRDALSRLLRSGWVGRVAGPYGVVTLELLWHVAVRDDPTILDGRVVRVVATRRDHLLSSRRVRRAIADLEAARFVRIEDGLILLSEEGIFGASIAEKACEQLGELLRRRRAIEVEEEDQAAARRKSERGLE